MMLYMLMLWISDDANCLKMRYLHKIIHPVFRNILCRFKTLGLWRRNPTLFNSVYLIFISKHVVGEYRGQMWMSTFFGHFLWDITTTFVHWGLQIKNLLINLRFNVLSVKNNTTSKNILHFRQDISTQHFFVLCRW